MSLLEDAQRLAEVDGSDGTGVCAICRTPPDMTFFGGAPSPMHAPDCPWLAMPRIVAALEAAQALILAQAEHPPAAYDEYQALREVLEAEA